MNKINFIKWKGLVTKSIDDYVVSAYFEISIPLYEQIHKHINEVLKLEVTIWDHVVTYDCNIDTSVKNYITHCWDHAMIRLDIHLKSLDNIILCWSLIVWDLTLLINK